MRRLWFLTIPILLTFLGPVSAQESERSVAQWIIRLKGSVTLDGQTEPVRDLAKLPAGELIVTSVDLTGTLVEPEQLVRLAGLTRLRELYLPGPMWNEGAGSKRDSNDSLVHLNSLKNLEKLHFSLHFLTNVNVQDKGMERLNGLG